MSFWTWTYGSDNFKIISANICCIVLPFQSKIYNCIILGVPNNIGIIIMTLGKSRERITIYRCNILHARGKIALIHYAPFLFARSQVYLQQNLFQPYSYILLIITLFKLSVINELNFQQQCITVRKYYNI